MTFQLNPSLWNGVFAVPACIVDEHLRLCSGPALKALLWILRHPGEENSPAALAEVLRQTPGDVADALNYWQECGVLLRCDESATVPQKDAPQEGKPAEPATVPTTKPILSRHNRPHFPRDEVTALIDGDNTLQLIIEECETTMGKALTSADLDTIVALSSYYNLSMHFILTAMHYCASIGKRSLAYIEGVCVAWINDNVTDETLDAYVDVLQKRNTNEGIIRKELGIGERRLSQYEKDCIARWFEVLHMPLELITHAYETAVKATGKLSFSYMDKCLTAWNKKQIDTVEKAEKDSLIYAEKNAKKKTAAAKRRENRANDMQQLIDEALNELEGESQ